MPRIYPPRSRSVRRYRKKTYKRKPAYVRGAPRQGSNIRTTAIRAGPPSTMMIKMRYAVNNGLTHNIASVATAVVDYPYRANSVYDPYAPIGGAQPRTYDQIQPLYRHFAVLGSQATIKFFYNPANDNDVMKVGLVTTDSTTEFGVNAQANISEYSRAVTGVLTASNHPLTLTKRWSYKNTGVTSIRNNKQLWGTVAADPSEVHAYHVCGYSLLGDATCTFTGWIDYLVLFLDPKQPVQS